MVFSQRAGYRYTQSDGRGTDFLFSNSRGKIREDGSEFPIVSSLDFRNYLIVTPQVDLDVSVGLSYYYYPMDTQEDAFEVDVVDEGAYANTRLGLYLTPYLQGNLYDKLVYKTDYVDLQGLVDEYGGQRYRYLNNEAGLALDWLMADDHDLTLNLAHIYNYPLDDEFAAQEYSRFKEGLKYGYQLTDFAVVGLTADFLQTAYTQDDRPDTRSQSYGTFTDVQVTERTLMNASLGYSIGTTHPKIDGQDQEETTHPVGALSFTTEVSRQARQVIGASQSMSDGFNSGFDIQRRYWYHLDWAGELTRAGFRSDFLDSDPSGENDYRYTDWRNGIELGRYIYREVELVLTSEYAIRNNDPVEDTEGVDPTLQGDYETWVTRLGTRLPVSRHTHFTTYVEHAERFSDNEDLAFTRDTFEAYLTYTREF